MTESQTNLDPSTFGFFLVAVVALPLALANLLEKGSPPPGFFTTIGLLAFLVGVWAWKCNANFGFTVFGLVGAAVFLTGYGIGYWENIAFAIVFAFSMIWAIQIGAGKNLILILLVTALLFLFVGLSSPDLIGGDYWHWLIGIDSLVLAVLSFYMGCSCAVPEKFKAF
ncbi:MAG: hypothetical protein J6V08_00155 [Candidatus Methanomethylophilaceae archaeon]|nr:hypothetical protein [Candidatus Methanomethylophilaceae archaeon]